MSLCPCPYLGAQVELTEERFDHIARKHPELIPGRVDLIQSTLAEPDCVVRSRRMPNARLFCRWYNDLDGGKQAVVFVVSDPGPELRHWIITAYLASKVVQGDVEWART